MAESRRPRRPATPSSEQPPLIGKKELVAVKLIGGGRALAHGGGMTWMILGALPGETVRAEPIRQRRRVIDAETTEVLRDRHAARLDDVCPRSSTCGGCDWAHVDPKKGAELKREVAAEAAARFPDISAGIRTAPVTPSEPAYRLRNRLHWDPVDRKLGFYAPKSWRVEDISPCRIITPALAGVLPGLSAALCAACPEPVDVETILGDDGLIAGLRRSRTGPKSIPSEWIPQADQCPGIDGFHLLTGSSEVVRGWGRDRVTMDLPIPLEVPLGSFFQGNRHLVPRLFETVAALVGPGTGPVFDLHGGVGFLAAAARFAGRTDVTIVEVNPGAAAAARRNMPHAEVATATAESFVHDRRNLPTDAVVITDPPRAGMTPSLRDQLGRWRPGRIIMLGCDPATWARDASELLTGGYAFTHLELVDLFPFTHHIEVLAVLEPA